MDWKTALTNLLKIKSLVTIFTTVVFCVLLLTGQTLPQEFIMVYTTIIAFYFGTQSQKNKDGAADDNSQ